MYKCIFAWPSLVLLGTMFPPFVYTCKPFLVMPALLVWLIKVKCGGLWTKARDNITLSHLLNIHPTL
jgi:hypothetical protein